jgi:uncharacterized protein YndB with AHSA1/START domain
MNRVLEVSVRGASCVSTLVAPFDPHPIEDRLAVDADDLWSAITDPRRLVRWHAKVKGGLRAGGEFRLFLESDDWEGTGWIEACEPPRRLLVTTGETDDSWRKGRGIPPFDNAIEVTLKRTATTHAWSSRSGACLLTRLPPTALGGKSTLRTSPHTSRAVNAATRRHDGASSPSTIRYWQQASPRQVELNDAEAGVAGIPLVSRTRPGHRAIGARGR